MCYFRAALSPFFIAFVFVINTNAQLAQLQISQREAFQQSSGKDTNTLRVGVAILRNTATRSVMTTLERDRLVSAINNTKPPKHSRDAVKIRAVALDGSTPDEANPQARDLWCDYIVFTTLTELRESGDPAPRAQPGDVRLGRDPVSNDPTEFYRHDIQRYAHMDFRLLRINELSPMVDTSVSDHEAMSEEGIVSALMDRVASRVVTEIRCNNSSHLTH
jgi:hypothetical protein